jgi:cytochrome c
MAASLETNKILAALLTAGIIASGSGVISRILYHPSMPEENAYVIEVPEGEAGDGEQAAEAEAVPLPVLLAAASPEEGASVAKKCAACHDFAKGGANKIGPPLWGVVGRDIASVEGFSYSDALLGLEGEWTFDALDAFIHNPKDFAPGTKMAFAGIDDPEDRADVLVYLRSLADEPVPLPEVAEGEAAEGAAAQEQAAGSGAETAEAASEDAGATAATGAEEAAEPDAAAEPAAEAAAGAEAAPQGGQQTAALKEAAPEGAAPAGAEPAGAAAGVGALLAQADLDAGAKDARKCAACHSFEEGGPAKIGPPLWSVVGRDIAAVEDFAYSDALAEKDGAWDYEALDAFLAEPRGWAPGTKMAFAGIKKPEERADVILYLRSLSNEPAPLP